jgi:uncharacterized protein
VRTKLFFLPILLTIFSVHVFGQGKALERIVDNAGLLKVSEKDELVRLIDSIASTYNFDLVIVTETDIGGISPGLYAADFFDDKGYGLGSDRDGCLFLNVTGIEKYHFSTSGKGENILNSYAFYKLESDTVKFLEEDNPYAACRAFILAWDQFLGLAAKGRNYNFFYQWNTVLLIIAWLVALGIGFVIVSMWKHGMNTALPKTQAAAYVVSGSLNFTSKKDSFLHSKTDKIKLQSQQAASLVKGGARMISSSGRSHGGGGGSYRSRR